MINFRQLLKPTPLAYSYLMLAGFILYILFMPIRMGDTDMWYHLNGGRYFWETGTIPTTAFFSFIEPTKEWINYFWGFQALIYKVYDIAGYTGLAVTRSIISILTVTVFFLLLKKENTANNSVLFFILITAILIIYEGRVFQLRPHLVSYLFILVFFYILEYRPKLTPALPVITIFWANIHGVEWPVPALVCGAYALPEILKIIKKQPSEIEKPYLYLVSIFACAPAFLINPYGWELFLAPFMIDSDTYLYIGELKKLNLATVSTLNIGLTNIATHSALSVLFALSVIYFVFGIFSRKISLTIFILFIGATLLLSRGTRFIWEWLLLIIPMMIFMLQHQDKSKTIQTNPSITFIFTVCILFSFGNTLYNKTKSFGDYPFDARGLPTDLGKFVSDSGATGRLLTPPSKAGYVEWKTWPSFKTFIDMQFPPSTDIDIFQLNSAYKNENTLRAFINKYSVDWISIPVKHEAASKNITKIENFIPVYLDDVIVLYGNRKAFPKITKNHALEYVNPHDLFAVNEDNEEQYLLELKKLFDLHPESSRISKALSWYYREKAEMETALNYTEHYIKTARHDPNSFYLHGLTLRDLGRYEEAIPVLKKTISMAGEDTKYIVERALGSVYFFKDDFDSAYKIFTKSINPYLQQASADELYMFAMSATITGDLNKALKLFDMVIFSASAEKQQDIIIKTKDMIRKIHDGDFDAPSFLGWIFKKLTNN